MILPHRRHYKLEAELAAMTWRIRWEEIRVDTGRRKRKTDLDAGSGPAGAKAKGHSPAPDGDADAATALFSASSPTAEECDGNPKKRKRKQSKPSKKEKLKEKAKGGKQPMKNGGSVSFSQKLMQRMARVRLLFFLSFLFFPLSSVHMRPERTNRSQKTASSYAHVSHHFSSPSLSSASDPKLERNET